MSQNVDLDKKEQEVVDNKHQFHQQINRKLEAFDNLAARSSSRRETDEEGYLKSLRAAYEESSSEDELQKRALELKRSHKSSAGARHEDHKLELQRKNRLFEDKIFKHSSRHMPEADLEEEGVRLAGQPPAQTRLDTFPTSYMGRGGYFQNAKLKSVGKTMHSAPHDYLETSEEEDTRRPEQVSRPCPLPRTRDLGPENLEGLTEDQLCLIKQMIDHRLKVQEPKARPKKKKKQAEEPDLVINDDFYDCRFLNLVYELESQKDESFLNY